MEIKHTIIIIAYNVENYIAEALDSCLNQSIKPYEIIIGENCSTDNTKKILIDYQEKYPDIIKIVFHKKNLGEYGNRNNLKHYIKPKGNMIHLLDGDDLFENGMFEEFNRVIIENDLNPDKEKFIIIPNVANLFLNGTKKIMLNNYKYRNYNNLMRLKIRNLIGSRNTGLSRACYENMPLWQDSLGAWADYYHTVKLYENVDKVYFIDKVFPLYRIGSGVTSNASKELNSSSYAVDENINDKQYNMNLSYYNVLSKLYKDDIKDKEFFDDVYLKKEIYKTKYILYKKKLNLLKYFIYKFFDLPIAMRYEGLYEYLKEFSFLLSKDIKLKIKRVLSK